VVAETFRALAQSKPAAAVFAASSVQEEIGLRGATVSAFQVSADIGIAVDVHWTSDHPQAPKTEVGDIRVGSGALLFRGFNTNPHIYKMLVAAAEAAGAPYQVDSVDRRGGTDANVMQLSRGGVATSVVGIPTRYLHTSSEVVSTDDLDAAVAILTRFVCDLPMDVDLVP
jgi:endoglucanase